MPSVIIPPTDVSPNTGSGSEVLSTSPTLVTPTIGAAIATSVQASGSGGLSIKSNSGTETILTGAGGGTGTTLRGGLVVEGAASGTTLALTGNATVGGTLTVNGANSTLSASSGYAISKIYGSSGGYTDFYAANGSTRNGSIGCETAGEMYFGTRVNQPIYTLVNGSVVATQTSSTLTLAATTASTSTSSGALVVGNGTSGGLGVGGMISVNGGVGVGRYSAVSGGSARVDINGTGVSGFPQLMVSDTTGRQWEFRGVDASGSFVLDFWNGAGSRTNNLLTISAGGNLGVLGSATVSATTASTSTSTGALVVSGGVGVAGAINAGGDIITTKSNGVIKASGSSANAEVAAQRLTTTPSSASLVAAVSQPQLAFTSDTAGSYTWGRILANSSEIVRVHSANLAAIANVAGAGIAVAGGIINTGNTTVGGALTVSGTTTADGLATSGFFGGSKRVVVGYNTSSDYGFVASVDTGIGWKELHLNPVGGVVKVPNTAASTSTSSGALVVGNGSSGGLGVGGAANIGGTLTVGSNLTVSGTGTSTFSGPVTISKAQAAAYTSLTIQNANASGYSQLNLISGSNTASINYAPGVFFKISIPSADSFQVSTNNITALTLTSAQQVQVNATTASTSTSSGALVVSGGVGVAGAITAGGTVRAVGSSQIIRVRHDASNIDFTNTAENAYVTGTVIGNTLQLHGNNGTGLTIGSTGNATFAGNITTGAPSGGTAAAWKLGTVATVSPTSPNRTIEVDIGGTIYYIHAKTTNN
jgi:hypothetical protein